MRKRLKKINKCKLHVYITDKGLRGGWDYLFHRVLIWYPDTWLLRHFGTTQVDTGIRPRSFCFHVTCGLASLRHINRSATRDFGAKLVSIINQSADVAVRVHRIPPPFPPTIWNVHDATMNEWMTANIRSHTAACTSRSRKCTDFCQTKSFQQYPLEPSVYII